MANTIRENYKTVIKTSFLSSRKCTVIVSKNDVRIEWSYGKQKQVIPLRNISSVSTYSSINYLLWAGGFLALLFGSILIMNLFTDHFSLGFLIVALFLIGLGVLQLMAGSGRAVLIEGGKIPTRIKGSCFEYQRIEDLSAKIADALSYEAEKTDMNIQSENIGKAVGNHVASALKNSK